VYVSEHSDSISLRNRVRNYCLLLAVCLNQASRRLQVEAAQVPEFADVQVDLDAVIGKDAEEVLINVAPKKANWDLRRDIAGKLAKLDRRTQRAMVQLHAQEEERRLQEEAAAE